MAKKSGRTIAGRLVTVAVGVGLWLIPPPEGLTTQACEYSIGTVTALNPVTGYDRSTELAAEAMKSGKGILELIRKKKVLSEDKIAKVFNPAAMTGAGARA
jgi:aspartate ammonia-lyase